MSISVFSCFMAFIWSSAFVIASAILQRRKPIIIYMEFLPLLLIPILSVVRLFISIELPYTNVIHSKTVFPKIMILLSMKLFDFGIHTIHVYTLLIFIWIFGIIFFWLKISLHYVRFRKHILLEQEMLDNRVYSLVEEIYKRDRKPIAGLKIVQTAYVYSPMIIGFFKPIMCLPCIQFSNSELEYILRHEFTHYIHKDLWIKFLFTLICSIYWWNPFIHILRRDADHLLELKSDLSLAKKLTEEARTQYLETLLKIAKSLPSKKFENRTHNISSIGIGFLTFGYGRKIKQRFQLVNSYKPMTVSQKIKNVCVCIFVLLAFTASFLFVVQPRTERPPDFNGSSMFTINMDDAYLIDNKDGSYSLYSYGVKICDVHDITIEPFSSVPIM